MMTHPASLFVIVFTVINVLACLWLLWWNARDRSETSSTPKEAQRTGHVWDGDLEEYNNPLPRWWLGLFIATVLFGAAYLTFFPGLGNFAGIGRWSSTSVYRHEMKEFNAVQEQRLAALRSKSSDDLEHDDGAMSMAKNLFAAKCSTCHGSDARGAKGFPNLTDGDWLWGGDFDTVEHTIAEGRQAAMPPFGAILGQQGVNEVASYVRSLSGGSAPPDWVAAGKERFAMLCVGCHGVDGRGNQQLGAPNLTDKIWLFGGDFDTIRATITDGRESKMPAHGALLGDEKVRLLAAYVRSLESPTSATGASHAGTH